MVSFNSSIIARRYDFVEYFYREDRHLFFWDKNKQKEYLFWEAGEVVKAAPGILRPFLFEKGFIKYL